MAHISSSPSLVAQYTRLLAPDLDVMNDERVAVNRPPPAAMLDSNEEVSVMVDAEVLPPE